MRRMLIVFCCAMTGSAPVGAAEVFDWTGPFVAAHAGATWRKTDGYSYGNPFANVSQPLYVPEYGLYYTQTSRAGQGAVHLKRRETYRTYGASAGYTRQFGFATIGAEARFSALDKHWQSGKAGNPTKNLFGMQASAEYALETRFRLGAAYDRLHVYGFAGPSWQRNINGYGFYRPQQGGYAKFDRYKKTSAALVYGMGAQWALTDHIFIGVEASRRVDTSSVKVINVSSGLYPYGARFSSGSVIYPEYSDYRASFRSRDTEVIMSLGFKL